MLYCIMLCYVMLCYIILSYPIVSYLIFYYIVLYYIILYYIILYYIILYYIILYSQQQNALGYNLSMQGIGTVAIDGPRFEEFWRSRKEFLEVSQGVCCWVAQLG